MIEDLFRAIARSDRTPLILVSADGTVLALNKSASEEFDLREGASLVEAAGPECRTFLKRCGGTADGHLGALSLPTLGKGRRRFRAEGARLEVHDSRTAIILRIRDLVGRAPGFATLNDKVNQLNSEIRRRRESEAHLRGLFETAADGIILLDPAGNVADLNSSGAKMFGYGRQDLLGKHISLLIPGTFHLPPDSHSDESGSLSDLVGVGREVEARRQDGSDFAALLSLGEAHQSGTSNYVAVVHDLTHQKRIEALLVQAQKMEAVGQLSGGIAHDFNNLLTVVIGNAELLAEELKARHDLFRPAEAILRAAERGSQLTQRLLAFGRRQVLRPEIIDCNQLVVSLNRLLARTLREDILVKTSLEEGLWPVRIDAAQLESALLNLAINAQDAMPAGGALTFSTGNIELDDQYGEVHPEVSPGRYALIAITDNGEGMSQETLSRAFEPFYTTKEIGKGSGLGLSMVYGFVKQSRGHIALYSQPGLGTTVRIYLPAEGGPPQSDEAATRKAPVSEGGHETILVVEDDNLVRAFAISCLESLGYRALPAANGPEALAILRQERSIDLLFSDIVMPGGINGWELAARARFTHPQLKVLLTSGYALESLARQGLDHPGYLLVDKPYSKATLAKRVRDALARPAPTAQDDVPS